MHVLLLGKYFVKQRETSSVLEVINTGVIPDQISWESTKGINSIKQHLYEEDIAFPKISDRVDMLVRRPMTRLHEVDSIQSMLVATEPREILHVIEDIMYEVYIPDPNMAIETPKVEEEILDPRLKRKRQREIEREEQKKKEADEKLTHEERKAKIKYERRKNRTYNKDIDDVSIYRIALESLVRVVIRHHDREAIAEECFDFLIEAFERYPNEVDVVLFVIKLMNEMADVFVPMREKFINVIMDIIQAHAPDPPAHRPRARPHRSNKPPVDAAEVLAEEPRLLLWAEEKKRVDAENEAAAMI